MTAIHKFRLYGLGQTKALLTKGFEILHVGLDPGGNPCVWVRIDLSRRDTIEVNIYTFATGEPIPEYLSLTHLGTYVQGQYVWHVFTDSKPT